MTCDDCQALIIDIARGDEIDRVSRDEVRRHAALCAPCGEQQQEQQWLTTQFSAIAAADLAHQAPERVEIAAVAAWRAAYASPQAQATPIVAVETRRSNRWMLTSLAMTGLAAAALAMVFFWPTSNGPHTSIGGTPSVQTARAEAPVTPNTAGTDSTAPRNTDVRGGRETVARVDTPIAAAAAAAVPGTPRLEAVMARATTRVTEEFLPLPYVEPLRVTEARHVVRVSMTSGDEMILGVLPADRRNGQPFEADVLVGEDGIARAIRVVR